MGVALMPFLPQQAICATPLRRIISLSFCLIRKFSHRQSWLASLPRNRHPKCMRQGMPYGEEVCVFEFAVGGVQVQMASRTQITSINRKFRGGRPTSSTTS